MKWKKFIPAIILIPAMLYGAFWSYVRYGGEEIKEIKPSDWIMEKPANVQQPAIHLQGAGNFRDVGKIYLDSLHFFKTGLLFRSDSPSKYTEADWKAVKELDVSLIIDLRSEKEVKNDPYKPIPGIHYIRNPVYDKDPIRSVMNHILFKRSQLGVMMADAYIRMVSERAASFGKSIQIIADNSGHGTIVHCTAGKDRTGILVAMILDLLGVDRKAILYDYSLSNAGFESNYDAFLLKDAGKLKMIGVPPDELKVLFMANPKWLENALDEISNQYGTMENYLITAGGLKKETIENLREQMITTDVHQQP